MASRVNTRFLIILTVSLVAAVAVVGGAAAFLLKNSAADLAALGDKKMAEGEYRQAVDLYSKAVNKEQTNSEYLNKWIKALQSVSPAEQPRYEYDYGQLMSASRQLGVVNRRDLESQKNYLDRILRSLELAGFPVQGSENLIREADLFIGYYVQDNAPDGPWKTLYRYRGIPGAAVVASNPDVKDDVITRAKADLDIAIATDPTDVQSVEALLTWYEAAEQRARARGETAAADALKAEARDALAAAVARLPESPRMNLIDLQRRIADYQVEVRGLEPAQALERTRQIRESLQPALEGIAGRLEADAADLDPRLLERFRFLEDALDPAAQRARTRRVLDAAIAARPDDARLLFRRAELLADAGQHTEAIELLDRVRAMPIPTISLAGLEQFGLRGSAAYLSALWSVPVWQSLEEPAAKEAALTRAVARRDELAKVESADSPRLALVDAQLAFINGDYTKANQLLTGYNRAARDSDPRAMLLTADVALKLNQSGRAAEALQRVLALQPGNLNAAMALGEIYISLQQFTQAREILQNMERMAPGNPAIQERLNYVKAMLGDGTLQDPTANALLTLERMVREAAGDEAKLAAAEDFLRQKAAELDYPPQLARELALARFRNEDRAGALEALDAGLARNPENDLLRRTRIAIATEDPIEARIAVANAQNLPPLELALAKAIIYSSAGRDEQAETHMAEAERLAPNDARVLEIRFNQAIEKRDFDAAAKIADRAASSNADNAGGELFRARLLWARGRADEALRSLEQMTARGAAAPEAWRLLGRVQISAGRNLDAIRSFEQALRLRPSDVNTIVDLVAAHRVQGDNEKALAAAREYERFARNDANFLDQWLTLEAIMGNRDFAIQQRESLARTAPTSRGNFIALADLYMQAEQWDKAQEMISRARALSPGLDVLALEADWHWRRNEREQSIAVFEGYITAIPEAERTAVPYLLLSQFALSKSQPELAVQALEQGRQYQDKATMPVDRSLVEVYAQLNRLPDAADSCQRVVDANADTEDGLYRRRLADLLIAQRLYAEAEAVIAKLPASQSQEASVMLLKAACRGGQGDTRGQRALLDEAVAKHPRDATVFLRRGQAFLREENRTRDAIADLSRAIQLRPDMWQAYRSRAQAQIQNNNVDGAIVDLREAVRVAPGNDDLLLGLLADLIRLNRDSDAVAVAEEAMARRASDTQLPLSIGDTFARVGRWDLASRFYRVRYLADKSPAVLQRYLDALLAQEPPNLNEADTVIRTNEQAIAANAGLTMTTAKIRVRQNRLEEGSVAAMRALSLIPKDQANFLVAWFNDIRQLITEPEKQLAFIERLREQDVPAGWRDYFKASVLLAIEARRDEGLTTLAQLSAQDQNRAVQLLSYRVRGATLYELNRLDEAARVWEEALTKYPSDYETMNNLAFLYSDKLGRPQDALPLAQKAADAFPNSYEVNDTLGVVQAKLGNYEDAVKRLGRALALVDNPQAMVTVSLHLAKAQTEAGKKPEATATLENALRVIDENPGSVSEESSQEVRSLLDGLKRG